MTLEEAERYRDEHALDLAHLANKRRMSRRRVEMEAQQAPDAETDQGAD